MLIKYQQKIGFSMTITDFDMFLCHNIHIDKKQNYQQKQRKYDEKLVFKRPINCKYKHYEKLSCVFPRNSNFAQFNARLNWTDVLWAIETICVSFLHHLEQHIYLHHYSLVSCDGKIVDYVSKTGKNWCCLLQTNRKQNNKRK